MFGNIESISKSSAIVNIKYNDKLIKDITNLNVVFESENSKILGSIESIEKNSIKINFLGEFTNNKFIPGVIKKPTLKSKIRIINKEELNILIGNNSKSFILGVSPLYNNFPIKITYNNFFSNHTAIFGNSGSGKTNGICRILQNIFTKNTDIPFNANLFIFDSYGEYINAFKDINKINPNINYKLITTSDRNDVENEKLQIPFNLLTVDDILNLLDANEYGQYAIVESALHLAKIFASNAPIINDYKNHILAKAINSILYSNQSSTRIRDQIFDILSKTYTKELNLEANIEEVGFVRKFSSCFEIDSEGKFAERIIVTKYIDSFINDNLSFKNIEGTKNYDIYDFQTSLNFTLLSERYLLNDKTYDEAISLKVKLNNLINSKYVEFFTDSAMSNIFIYLNEIVTKNDEKAQIININLEDIDDSFARTIVKIFSRMFFQYTKSLKERASSPIHIILEEAHRYVKENDDIKILGYNIFERIAKEGRKYGLILDLITQRPVELNPNIISQVDNCLIFKITHPTDLDYIIKTIPSINEDIVEKLKTLQPGSCIAFGRILNLPMIVKMEKANPEPSSANCDIYNTWMN